MLAYHQQDTESFCEAIVRTFDILGSVTQRFILDNGRVAVKERFGSHAKMQDKYAALSIHYGFDAVFCNPAQGHEKGLVEGLVGWARRNICVLVPKVKSINELNSLLLRRCIEYENHTVRGRKASVGIFFAKESKYLHSLPKYTFDKLLCLLMQKEYDQRQ